MDASVLENLEARISNLEQRVKGDLTDNDQTVIKRLSIIDSKLNETIQDKESLSILKRTDVLQTLLDPALLHNFTVDDPTKLTLVEANMGKIEEAKQMLDQVESLKTVLESAHIKTVPTYSGKICALSEVQTEQMTQIESLTKKAMTMFETYNRIMADLDRKFAVWDERLTNAEELINQKKKKP